MFGLSLGLEVGKISRAAAAAVTGSTWNPADKSATITLSAADLTATSTSATQANVRGTAAKASGYFEVTINNKVANLVLGIDAGLLTLNDFAGDRPDSVGYQASGAALNNAGSVGGTYAAYTTGDVIGVCLKAGKVYFSKNGTWQNSADPSAGTGGITPSGAIATGFPIFTAEGSGDAVTINTGGSAFLGTIPTGVTAWG